MIIPGPKKIFFIFLLALFSFSLQAQQVHFIYLQTDNGQPFYAKLNNKLVSSSSQGYIIIPNITNGAYDLVVGFPKNEFPEKDYTIKVDNDNEGFLLKKFDEKGWQLFNLQTLALIEGKVNRPVTVAVKNDADSFTRMLAGVVKDSSILQNHDVTGAPPVKPADSVTALNQTDKSSAPKKDSIAITAGEKSIATSTPKTDSASLVAVNSTIETSINKIDSSTKNNSDSVAVNKENSSVSRILSNEDKNGLMMLYADKSNSKTDTVSVFMPLVKEQSVSNTEVKPAPEIKKGNISSSTDTTRLTITPTFAPTQKSDSASVAISNAENDSVTHKDSSGIINAVDSLLISHPSEKDSIRVTKNPSDENNAEQKVISETEKPVMQNEIINENKDSSVSNNKGNIPDAINTNVPSNKPENVVPDNKDQSSKLQNDTNKNQVTVLPEAATKSWVNSDCRNFATNSDFLKLRKKMAAENGIDDMLKVARKYFKSACFSTEQIKNLSFLFLTDEGKYMFFDEAYPYSSDSDQYQTLQSQFTDPYYLNRFKAMIRKQ